MKFTCSVEIERPIDEVVMLFDNVDNLKEWQDDFVSYQHLSGTPGAPGAKAKLTYKSGKRIMELFETITVKNLPQEFSGVYEHKHMVNTMTNSFVALGANRTRYEAKLDYTKLIGVVPKLMAFFMPGMFKKQTQKWLDQFKAFAEKDVQNR